MENAAVTTAKKQKQKNPIDFLNGSLWDKILLFALPITITNILQQLFNTADIAVVGRLVGKDALAAVGSTGPVVSLFITLFSGLAAGANAIISRCIGAGNEKKVRTAVHTSIAIALASGIAVTVLGEIISEPLLKIVGTPENVVDDSVKYLRIYFSGSIFVMLYNFEAAILRSAGDTKTPVYVLFASGVINICLNLLFVIGFGMSVDGVAFATMISNVISGIILFVILTRRESIVKIYPHEISFDAPAARNILLIGIPAAIQGVLFNAANIVIQSGINSLGADVVAGATVGQNVETYAYYAAAGLGQASITFNSQNYGAGKPERCAAATKQCILLGIAVIAVISAFMIGFRDQLAGIFTSDPEVIRTASERIIIIAGFEIFNMMIEVMSGALRGVGYSVLPTSLSVIFICGVRLLWLFFVFPMNRTFVWLFTVYPVSWILDDISLFIAYFIIKKKLMTKHAQSTQT